VATQRTAGPRRSAAPTSTGRQLTQQSIQLADSIAESRRATPAQRASARRARDRLAARLRAGPALTAKDRAALLTALIRTIARLIERIDGQTGLARALASLKKVRQQAQALLAMAKQPAARGTTHRKVAARPPAAKKAAAKPVKKNGGRRAPKKAAAKRPPAKKAAARPVKKNGGRRAPKKSAAPESARQKVSRAKPSGAKPSRPGAAPISERGLALAAPDAPPAPPRVGTPSPAIEPEPVFLGVSAPRAVKPGGTFIARFAAYIKALEAALEKKLKALGGDRADVYLGFAPDEAARWQVGTPVTVRVSGDGFTADPAQGRFVWNGSENLLSFTLKVAASAPEGPAILSFEAYIEGVRVAFIPLEIEVTAQPKTGMQKVKASPARTAFASYASRDRDRVLDKLGALSAYDKGLDIFTDCLDLKPGDGWKERLEEEIPSRDLFLLFWSRAAAESQWVGWEWRTALDKKGLAAIQPMPLEAPQTAPPPPELSSLHFNDLYLLVRDAELARRKPPQ